MNQKKKIKGSTPLISKERINLAPKEKEKKSGSSKTLPVRPASGTNSQSQSLRRLSQTLEPATPGKERALEKLREKQELWMQEVTKKIEKSQRKFLSNISGDLDRILIGDYEDTIEGLDSGSAVFSASDDESEEFQAQAENTPSQAPQKNEYLNVVNLL